MNPNDLVIGNIEISRHWHPDSKQYAGVDCLLTALDEGWIINNTTRYLEFAFGGARRTAVYYFELKRRDEIMTMPVIDNPVIARVSAAYSIMLECGAPPVRVHRRPMVGAASPSEPSQRVYRISRLPHTPFRYSDVREQKPANPRENSDGRY